MRLTQGSIVAFAFSVTLLSGASHAYTGETAVKLLLLASGVSAVGSIPPLAVAWSHVTDTQSCGEKARYCCSEANGFPENCETISPPDAPCPGNSTLYCDQVFKPVTVHKGWEHIVGVTFAVVMPVATAIFVVAGISHVIAWCFTGVA